MSQKFIIDTQALLESENDNSEPGDMALYSEEESDGDGPNTTGLETDTSGNGGIEDQAKRTPTNNSSNLPNTSSSAMDASSTSTTELDTTDTLQGGTQTEQDPYEKKYDFMEPEDKKFCTNLEKMFDQQKDKNVPHFKQLKERLKQAVDKRITMTYDVVQWIAGTLINMHLSKDGSYDYVIIRPEQGYEEGQFVVIDLDRITSFSYWDKENDPEKNQALPIDKMSRDPNINRSPDTSDDEDSKPKSSGAIPKQTKNAASTSKASPPSAKEQGKRTEKGWETKKDNMSYADKAKKAGSKDELSFNWTQISPAQKPTDNPDNERSAKRKNAWIKVLHRSVEKEIRDANGASLWPDFKNALKQSFQRMGMLEVGDAIDGYDLQSECFLNNNRLIDQIWQKAEALHQHRISDQNERMTLWKSNITEELEHERKTTPKPNYARIRQILVNSLKRADIKLTAPTLVQKLMRHDLLLPTNAKLTRIWHEANALSRIQLKNEAEKAIRIGRWKDEVMTYMRRQCFHNTDDSPRRLGIEKMLVRTLHEAGVEIPPSKIGIITDKYDVHAWNYSRLEKVWKDAEAITQMHAPYEIEYDESFIEWLKDLRKNIIPQGEEKLSEKDLQDLYNKSLWKHNIRCEATMVKHLNLIKGDEWETVQMKHVWKQAKIDEEIMRTRKPEKQRLYEEWVYNLPYYFNKESRRASRHIPFAVDYHKALRDSLHSVCIFMDKEFISKFHLPGVHMHLHSDQTKEIFETTYDQWVTDCESKYLMPNYDSKRDKRPTESEYQTAETKAEWTQHFIDYINEELQQEDWEEHPFNFEGAIQSSLMHMGLYLDPHHLEDVDMTNPNIRYDARYITEIWEKAIKYAVRARRHVSHGIKYSQPYYILMENWKYQTFKALERSLIMDRECVDDGQRQEQLACKEEEWTMNYHKNAQKRTDPEDDDFSECQASTAISVGLQNMQWDVDYDGLKKVRITEKTDFHNGCVLEQAFTQAIGEEEYQPLLYVSELAQQLFRTPQITPKHTQERDQLMSPDYEQMDSVPWKYTVLPMTRGRKVDAVQLNFDYQRTLEEHQLSFRDWIKASNAAALINQDDKLTTGEPEILLHITRAGHREFFLANWMLDYPVMRLNFEVWYEMIGHKLKVPSKTSKKFGKNTTGKRSPQRADSYADAGIPALTMHPIITDEHKPDQVIRHCNLQAPPESEPKKQPRQLSWSDELEETDEKPNKRIKKEEPETEPESSDLTTAPYIVNEDGKVLTKPERQDYYNGKLSASKYAIEDELTRTRFANNMSRSEYNGVVKTIAVKLPPLDRTIWELEAIKANTIVDPRVEHSWVEPHHFLPGGKLAHMHIPKYVYIPHDVFDRFKLRLAKGTTSYVSLWRHLSAANDQANKHVTHEHMKDNQKTDYRAMLTSKTPKTIITKKIDVVQHKHAHIEARKIGWKNMTQRNIYDWFVRPIERLFAVDMPQGTLLMRALLFKTSADKLHEVVCKYTGIPKTAKLTPTFLAEEMSRIRMSFDIDFQKRNGQDRPTTTLPRLKLQPDEEGVYFMKTSDYGNQDSTSQSDTYEPTDDDSIYEDEIGEWDNILKEYKEVKREQQSEVPKWIKPLLSPLQQRRFQSLLDRCQQKRKQLHEKTPCPDLTNRNQTKMTIAHVKPVKSEEDDDNKSISSSSDDEEQMDTIGNLGQAFNNKLHFQRRYASDINEDSKLNTSQQAHYKNMRYYADKAEELQIDIIKTDPADTDLLDMLTRARDNLLKAKEIAAKDLQKSLDKEDRKQRKESQKAQKKSRQLQRKQKRQQKRNSTTEQNTTPTQPPKPKRSRPTAMPTAKQLQTQNPWKVTGPPVMKPFVRPHSRAPNTTPANTTAGSPNEQSFNRNVTLTSTPKYRSQTSPNKTNKQERKTNTSSTRTWKEHRDEPTFLNSRNHLIGVRTWQTPPSSRDSSYDILHEPKTSRSRSPRQQRTRQRSPSPPRPNSGTKFQRKRAPNGDHLYHYKLWSPLNTTYPPFAHTKLSAEDVDKYLTGLHTQEDTTSPTNTITFGAHGFDTTRKITIKPNLVTNEVEFTEVIKYTQEPFGEFHVNGFNIPIEDLSLIDILIGNAFEEQMQPLSKDRLQHEERVYRQKILTTYAKYRLTILYRPTTKGPERIVHIAMDKKINKKKADSGFITIPWLLLIKLVKAIKNMREYFKNDYKILH